MILILGSGASATGLQRLVRVRVRGVESLIIMPRVFINLLYTHTMPNNHYCSTYMLLVYPHLMAKHCLTIGRKSGFLPDLRHETCLHVAVKVWWMDLQSCWELSSSLTIAMSCSIHLLDILGCMSYLAGT